MGLRYTMSFSDLAGCEVGVSIYNDGWTGGVTVLTGGASPLTLDEDASEGIDRPCRAWTGVLTVLTEDGTDYSGLYAADVTSARVEVWRGGGLTWQGYLVPEVMRQSWVAGEELSVNVQSPLGALAGLTLDKAGGFGYARLGALLGEALALTGDWDTVTFPDDLSVGGGGTDTWLDVEVSRMAFFTREYNEEEWDEGEQARIVYEGATGREVVEAVARLTGWTARERGRALWLTAESVAGYKRVGVAELGLPGRQVEDVAAPVMELDALTPAGTDHTVSTLRGYRRVRVRFGVERPDTLIPGNDLHNWEPETEYEFREDQEFVRRDRPEESAGYYVSVNTSDYTAGSSRDPSAAINYMIAPYKTTARDGLCRAYLYGLYRTTGTEAWTVGDFPTYGGQPAIPLDRWASPMGLVAGSDRSSFAGARRCWLRWRKATVDSSTERDYVYAYDFEERVRDSGYLLYVAADRWRKVPALYEERRPAIRLISAESYYLTDCAILIGAEFSGFWGVDDPDILEPNFPTYRGKIGPWAVTRNDAITSWPLRLRVGTHYWNGESWQTEACDFTVNLRGATENDRSTIEPTGRQEDADKYDNEDGYLALLRDADGNEITLTGQVELVVYFPNQATATDSTPEGRQQLYFNPILIRNVNVEAIQARTERTAYEDEGSTDTTHTYQTVTGYKGAEDVYEVETTLGTWANDGCAMNVLIKDGAPVEAFTSKRQGGRTGRPERLLLSTLGRLYGRARRQLEVEVDAAGLPPSVTLTDSGRRYTLTGLHWDVREGTARYVMEDFIPIDN